MRGADRESAEPPARVTAQVNFATEKARVRYSPDAAGLDRIIGAVGKAGYGAHAIDAARRTQDEARHAAAYRSELVRFWISAALTLPFLVQMGAMFAGARHDLLPPWLQLAFATPVQLWVGRRFYVGAWHALRGGGANMDVLIALGTTMAYVYSATVVLLGLELHLYFEASTAIITLVLMGKLLEIRARSRASAAVEELMKLSRRRRTSSAQAGLSMCLWPKCRWAMFSSCAPAIACPSTAASSKASRASTKPC